MANREYLVDIKPLRNNAEPDRGYTVNICCGFKYQIKVEGQPGSILTNLISLSEMQFVRDRKGHKLTLREELE